ncbi:hypothetical protein ACKKBG_A39460 [Auxenochlorella protothecoides x Auxenochlorella symbiontica]
MRDAVLVLRLGPFQGELRRVAGADHGSLCRPPAVGACCAWAYCHGDECAARLRVAEGLICQRGIGQRSAVCWADTRSPPLRQAPHAMARMLLGGSLAVVDAAQDGPAALALGVSAPWRIMLRSAICPSYIL